MKNVSLGIKNELNYYRNSESDKININHISLNNIFFQEHLFIGTIESSIILLMCYKNRVLFTNYTMIHQLFLALSHDLVYCYYIILLTKNLYSYSIYYFVCLFLFS